VLDEHIVHAVTRYRVVLELCRWSARARMGNRDDTE
jgi:hypothetical protein